FTAGRSWGTTRSKTGRATMSTISVPEQYRNMVIDMVTAKDFHGYTALSYATNSGVMEIIKVVSASMRRFVPPSQMLDVYSSSFSTCCANLPSPVSERERA
ncbi:unnamed protein product, partial [Laminaria digitata]